jgi:hypothetical protein
MDQLEFEEAIKGYATKKDSVIPEYEINLHTKRKIIDYRTHKEKVSKPSPAAVNARALITPHGTFPSVRAASIAYGKTIQWVYNQIHKGEGFTYDNKG